MNQFTTEELRNLQVFLSRVQITGNEALPLVLLQQKMAQLLNEQGAKAVPETKNETGSKEKAKN